jgi:hypothetical protein
VIKQLKIQFCFGLIGIATASVVTPKAFAVDRLEQVFIGSSKLFIRSFHGTRMHRRFYSSAVNPNPDIALTAAWNKGYVPNGSFNKQEPKETFSPVLLFDQDKQDSCSPIKHVKQHKSNVTDGWFFDPIRSLYFRRDYYNREEIKKPHNSSSPQKQPTEIDADTVQISIEKARKD